jgi:hypothetical protein
LVYTAGTLGKIPVKFIDFLGNTYAICPSQISRWNGSTWDNVTAPSDLSVEDCEDAWNELVDGSITSATDDTDFKVGTYAVKLTQTGTLTAGDILATEVITSADLSSYYAIRLWIKSDMAFETGELQLLLDDTASCASPVETLDIPTLLADTWTQVTLPLADPSLCTAIISVGIKTAVDIRWPFQSLVLRIDDVDAVGAGPITDPVDAIVFKDATDTYLVVSTPSMAIYSDDGNTWSYLEGCRGVLGIYDMKLCGIDTDGSNFRLSAAGDIDGTWTTFTISEDIGTVHRMFSAKLLADETPTLYFTATKGLWSVDVTNNKVYRQEVNYPPLDDAGRAGMYWNANVYVSTGGGIVKVAPSMATPVGPDLDDGLPDGYQGTVYDMVGVGPWMVYCVDKFSTGRSTIYKRHSNYGGNIPITYSAANSSIKCILHSPSSMYTNGRLWWNEGANVRYCMFPDTASNIKQISTYTYAAASLGPGLILPKFRKLAAINKVALGVAAVTADCDASDFITIWYKANNAAAWTILGYYKTSPRPTILTFNSGLGTEFYVIQFGLKFERGATTTNSPVLESLMFYYIPVPVRISRWSFGVICDDENAQATIEALETLQDTNTLIAFYPSGDEAKDSFNVKLTQMPGGYRWENQGGREGIVQVVVEEVFKG